ncbi:DUF5719 family protein [Myceligenerans pegani]|uniref:Secreted protein n=1 Tax=Myceligenerans pegani TaxID=2776917 RepID=A0ABR9MYC9_9MICO|nr:DUF5719 family protein [Myceligenerans sp. TRM 65318]MBE1876395.1 hypothetical protein [Myceligenerans sp. TRM 65318]MBE3018666.1 hypothetical protein [Myceligenerans sp. TRM 65318]
MTAWSTTRRIGAHAISVACVAAVAMLAQHVPDGGADTEPARTVDVAPGETTLVCPSPAELVQEDVGDDQFDASPVETESELAVAAEVPDVVGLDGEQVAGGTSGGTAGHGEATGDDGEGDDEAGSGDGAEPDNAARVIRAEPGALAAATATSVTTAGDLRGLVAGACREPAVEHWLVGGSSDVGSSSRLVLQNPGRTAASVSLEVWGPSGPVTLGGHAVVVVPAGEQVSTTLEAIAPGQGRVVVHAVSQGARVAAYLQHHRIDGLVPQGADLVTGGAAPSSALAVVGVDSQGEAVDDPHAPALRLLAPGDSDGTARLSVYGADGRVWLRGVDEVPLHAGAVTDLPLGGLPEGRYAVVVDATVPVVGGGLVHRQGSVPDDAVIDEEPYDTAWIAGQAVGSGASTVPERADDGGAGADGDADAHEADGSAGGDGGDAGGLPPSFGLLAVPDDVSWAVNVAAVPTQRGEDDDPIGTAEVTITGYAADGTETGMLDVELPAGEDADLSDDDLEPLGENVAAIGLTATGDALTTWSLRLTDDSLIATLTPPETASTQSTVAVRNVVAD